jgi:hypothetical protein
MPCRAWIKNLTFYSCRSLRVCQIHRLHLFDYICVPVAQLRYVDFLNGIRTSTGPTPFEPFDRTVQPQFAGISHHHSQLLSDRILLAKTSRTQILLRQRGWHGMTLFFRPASATANDHSFGQGSQECQFRGLGVDNGHGESSPCPFIIRPSHRLPAEPVSYMLLVATQYCSWVQYDTVTILSQRLLRDYEYEY